MSKLLRLDRYLSEMGIGTRSEVKTWIRNGRVKVNGIRASKANIKVEVDKDKVSFDEKTINYQKYFYYMLNKPAGVVSATKDNIHKTVIDLIDENHSKNLFPVGRLDKDTEGLLILTNDGELAHRLLSPRNNVDKTYYAIVSGLVTEEDQLAFEKGVDIGDGYITLPAKLEILVSDKISEIKLTIREGKFHQVKRMFQAVNKKVVYLKRLSMGGLELDTDLTPGQYRPLTDEEITLLKVF